ncbi:MAG: hypothetical protein ACREC0_12825 [Methylocella sp.]
MGADGFPGSAAIRGDCLSHIPGGEAAIRIDPAVSGAFTTTVTDIVGHWSPSGIATLRFWL